MPNAIATADIVCSGMKPGLVVPTQLKNMTDTLRVTPEKAIPTILVRKESGGNYESIMHGFPCLLSVKGPATGSCLKNPILFIPTWNASCVFSRL